MRLNGVLASWPKVQIPLKTGFCANPYPWPGGESDPFYSKTPIRMAYLDPPDVAYPLSRGCSQGVPRGSWDPPRTPNPRNLALI